MKREDLHEGQEVLVFGMNGPAQPGIVKKVGTKLVQIQTQYSHSWTPYRIEDQSLNTDYMGHFRTLEQQVEVDRDIEDLKVLKDHGFKQDSYARPDRTKLRAIAELLRSMP